MEILAFIQFCLKIGLGSLGIIIAILARKERIKLATAEIGKNLKGYEGETGFRISTNKRLSEKASQEHIVIIAPTGANKTTSEYIPNMLEDKLQGSLVIADPKGELYKLTHKYQESIGRRTILYKPLEGNIEYSPIKECSSNREIMQLAQNLLINGALSIELQTGRKATGVEWLQMSQSLLTAALMKEKNIQNALKLIISNDTDKLGEIFTQSNNEAIQTQYNAFKMCLDSERTVASIKITISSNLQLFLDDLRINKSSFNADTLREKPTALYISYPENKANYLSPLTACIYSQLIDKLIDNYVENESIPVHFLVDEFANQGMWMNMSTNISTARSRLISFVLCLQSISQLKQIYGQDNALSILNNCKTKIILPGISDISTLEYLSKLCGEEEILLQQEGRKVKTKKLLFTPEEIRTLDDDSVLIISRNFHPLLETQNIWWKQDFYKERVK